MWCSIGAVSKHSFSRIWHKREASDNAPRAPRRRGMTQPPSRAVAAAPEHGKRPDLGKRPI